MINLLQELTLAFHFTSPLLLIILISFIIVKKSNLKLKHKKTNLIVYSQIGIALFIIFLQLNWVLISGITNQSVNIKILLLPTFMIYFIYFLINNRKYFNIYLILIILFSLLLTFTSVIYKIITGNFIELIIIFFPMIIICTFYFLVLDFFINNS